MLVCTSQFISAQVPNYVPTNGLVGYWPFNGNANDASGNANNGTNNGATLTTDRFGNANSAYSFNGTSNYINLNIVLTSPFSISLWVNVNQFKSYAYGSTFIGSKIIGTINNNYPNTGFECGLDGVQSNYGIHGCAFYNNTNISSNNLLTLNNWKYVVCTYDGINLKYYDNGQLIGSASGVYNLNQSKLTVGARLVYNNNSPYFFLDGKVDDIGVWNRALTQQEITSLYTGVPSYSSTCNAVSGSLVNGLVGYWPFCGNANDQSGHGYNGTVNGATLTTDRFGNTNAAYMFQPSSTAQSITTNYTGITGNNNRSISLWFNQNSVDTSTDAKVLCGYGTGTANSSFVACIYQNRVGLDISSCTSYYSPNTYGNWHHYVITYDNINGNSVQSPKIYLDGVLLTSVYSSYNLPGVINTISGGNFAIGGGNLINQFSGKIDDVGIWNRALTTQEVTQLYNQNQCFTNTTVTDTLVINVGQMGFNPATYANNITIYPNPASTQVNISFNTIADLNGGTIKIINALGQQVATTPITTTGTNTTMTLSTWGGAGLYFVQIVNPQGQIVDIKKILLQ